MLTVETRVLEEKVCELELKVTVPDERAEEAKRAAARRLAQRIKVPGFRPGKIPYEVVRRRVGDAALLEESLEDLGQKVYTEALDQAEIDPYAAGQLADIALDPLVLTFHIPMKPDVDLGDYKDVRVAFEAPVVDDAAVEEALERLRSGKAELTETDAPAAKGDQVVVDVSGTVAALADAGEDAEDEFLLDDEDVELILADDLAWPMPGFADELLGMKAGEEKTSTMTFADDYPNEGLAGRVATLQITCKAVKKRALPEWSDELAQSLEDGKYKSLKDLRKQVRADLEAHERGHAEEHYSEAVIDEMLAGATIKYPAVMLERELDDVLNNMDRRLREQNLSLDEYMKLTGRSKEQVREEARPSAELRLRRSLLLSKLIEAEQIVVVEADVQAKIDEMLAPFNEMDNPELQAQAKQFYEMREVRESIELELMSEKAVNRAKEIAQGDTVKPKRKSKAKAAEVEAASEDAPAEKPKRTRKPAAVAAATAEGDAPAEKPKRTRKPKAQADE